LHDSKRPAPASPFEWSVDKDINKYEEFK
jgi:hypothetical protein